MQASTSTVSIRQPAHPPVPPRTASRSCGSAVEVDDKINQSDKGIRAFKEVDVGALVGGSAVSLCVCVCVEVCVWKCVCG